MSYQVLARKWRPRAFAEMVGQTHVLRALINALDNDRLHHAYLFTGTRGVGKTTVARIFAKSLNCERGVSAMPCGVCGACREIDEGRFVDLIEVDAASRTKVEDTRDLLENVQYAPTRGRYKVYLIDEVHMLSAHSFNALLKTLEEPPPHVKFLLATTDPQRLPVTILSRCLQFNLKRLPADMIGRHLVHILAQEGINCETPALAQIARAADGSLRDALSLLDQAIAYGGGQVLESEVRAMLGAIEQGHVLELAQALAAGDAQAVLERVHVLAEQSPDFGGVLAELISLWHRVALAQAVPAAVDDELGDREAVLRLAGMLSPEDVQLFYQIGLIGRRDLPLAPDPRNGLEMVLLRMLAFRPAETEMAATTPVAAARQGATVAAPVRQTATPAAVQGSTVRDMPPQSAKVAMQPDVMVMQQAMSAPAAKEDDWATVIEALRLDGMARQLAANCTLKNRDGENIHLTLAPTHASLRNKRMEERLQQALSQHYGIAVKLTIDIGAPQGDTPALIREQRELDRQQAAVEAIRGDPNVHALQESFNARVVPDSIQPV
ncbi:MAG: DNA polymerase III subunit gamma/tau [Gammaproteobacteria bacterium]|nr:DNA polymerase III subunit gamma/tau [Gammaproteobacteria bacterium]